jgi:hypothetical protein
LLFALAPTLGAGVALVFLAGVALTKRRSAPLAGLLVGLPGPWLLLIGNATLACQRFNEVPSQGCEAPDITTWVVVAIGLLGAGILLTLAATRKPREFNRR